jgi:ketosteroid isomerase-like protein
MDFTEIRELLANLSASARAGDVEGIVANYHPAASAFEFGQRRRAIGIEGIRETCERGYNGVNHVRYDFEVERIEGSEDLAYCYGLEHISGEQRGRPFEMYTRATYAFRRVNGRWSIVHQHLTAVD